MDKFLQKGNSRVFINTKRGTCGVPYEYHANMKLAGIDKSYGDSTPQYQPSDTKLNEFVEIASIRGTESRWSSSLSGRIPATYKSVLKRMAEAKCSFDAQVHFGTCANPSSFTNYDSVIILENILISNYSTDDLVALTPDERGLIQETVTITAENIYDVYDTELSEIGSTVSSLGMVVAMTKGNYSECEDCNEPCQSYFGLILPMTCSVGGNNITIIYSLDDGATWGTFVLTAAALVCSNKLETYNISSDGTYLYITFDETPSDGGMIYVVPIYDVINNSFGTAVKYDLENAISVYSQYLSNKSLWIAGTLGNIFQVNLTTYSVTMRSNNELYPNVWYSIDGLDDENIIVGGETGRVLVKINDSSFRLVPIVVTGMGAITADIYNVVMKTKKDWMVATTGGDLFCTSNAGKTWSLVAKFNACIAQIEFSTNNVGVLATKQPAKVYRTIDAGYSWQEVLDEYDAIQENAAFLGVVNCSPNRFYTFGINSLPLDDPCDVLEYTAGESGIIVINQ